MENNAEYLFSGTLQLMTVTQVLPTPSESVLAQQVTSFTRQHLQYGMYYNLYICRHLQNRCRRKLARVSVIGGNFQDVYRPLMASIVTLELHQTRDHFTLIIKRHSAWYY